MKTDHYLTRSLIRKALITGVGVFFATVCTTAADAQQQPSQPATPEVQELKDRLKQLEQTVEQLKTQIVVIEDAKKKSDQTATGEKIAAPATMPAEPAGTAAPAKAPDDNTSGESTFSIYGFVMLDAGFQFR